MISDIVQGLRYSPQRTLHLFVLGLLFVLALAMLAMVEAQTTIPLKPFSSVELRNGGRVILRYGPAQRVTFLKGSPDCTSVTIAQGGQLVIDSSKRDCPGEHDLQIEIVTPNLARVSVANGGLIGSSGSFPRQAEITVAVSQGGVIDIRLMSVDSVTASVDSGGLIFTRAQTALFAKVAQGGNITYWGDARVKSSVQHGGVVTKGNADEADKPLSELGPAFQSLSAIPPVPPIPPLRNPGR